MSVQLLHWEKYTHDAIKKSRVFVNILEENYLLPSINLYVINRHWHNCMKLE